HPAAFVEDTIKFPLGLGAGPSAAGTATPGAILADVLPGGAAVVTAILGIAVVGIAGWLLRKRPWPKADGAARSAAVVWAVLFLLAPVARVGYAVYPINLLMWSIALWPNVSSSAEGSTVSIAGSVSS
ncbi:MAG TPA: hypothetical protein VKA30_07425, partial [Actinomycetota bacterium]|nr:hypothetical protein [Actinomycetota bacterium]